MNLRQYGHAALVGAAVALGDIGASQFNGHQLGALHVLISCVVTALVTVKIISVSINTQR